MPPLSLYVHLPWCVRKCPYCDFNSHQRPAALPEMAYVDALLADLDFDLALVEGRPLQSIFFGGGTPSLFSGASIRRLLDGVRARIAWASDCELSLEANPGAAEFDRFESYLEAGINRISFGVQSFDDAILKRLGRIHDSAEVLRAVAAARAAGVANINLDLMHALPGQDAAMAAADLRQAIDLGPEHISYYQLTLEPGTVFARFPPEDLPDEDLTAEIGEQGMAMLDAAGYRRYEVSAYAQAGRQCRHNLNYWLFGDYLGIGAGAHAKLSLADGRILRRARQRSPSLYLRCAGSAECLQEQREVDPSQRPFEFMLNALRLVDGFPTAMFSQRTGLDLHATPGLQRALEQGLVEFDADRLRPSPLGLRFLNQALEAFLPAGPHGA